MDPDRMVVDAEQKAQFQNQPCRFTGVACCSCFRAKSEDPMKPAAAAAVFPLVPGNIKLTPRPAR